MFIIRKISWVAFCVLIVVTNIYSCELDQTQNGCRIDNGVCFCSFGCKSEFRYESRSHCQEALKGTTNDICGKQPCLNSGVCIQVSQSPGYRCRCEGTGFWGSRCQRLCPDGQFNELIPYECIVI